MKVVYIAHPIGGDVEGNVKKLQDIYREVSLNNKDVVPFIPYMASVLSLNDDDPEERKLGFSHNEKFFVDNVIDEVWLYGPCISSGMQQEILWATLYKIPVVPMSRATQIRYNYLIAR